MTYQVYKDRHKEWRWTLYANNGKKVADCGEGYKRRGACVEMIKKINPNATIEFKQSSKYS